MVSISEIRLDIQTLSFLLVESRASPPGPPHCWMGETPVPPSYDSLRAGCSDWGLDLRYYAFQVLEGLIDGKRIHFAP
jgi:hypothetical protein